MQRRVRREGRKRREKAVIVIILKRIQDMFALPPLRSPP